MINDKYMDLIKPEWKESYLRYKEGKNKLCPFSSHQPLLIHTLNTITEGRVLEYGMGWHSTPLMHLICGMQKRELISVESDPIWFRRFASYETEKHKLLFISGNELKKWKHPFLKEKFAIALIDGEPGELRRKVVKLMMNNVDYFVVHDTEEWAQGFRYPGFSYKWDFSGFKHQHHLMMGNPNASLLSNLNKINEDLLTVFP